MIRCASNCSLKTQGEEEKAVRVWNIFLPLLFVFGLVNNANANSVWSIRPAMIFDGGVLLVLLKDGQWFKSAEVSYFILGRYEQQRKKKVLGPEDFNRITNPPDIDNIPLRTRLVKEIAYASSFAKQPFIDTKTGAVFSSLISEEGELDSRFVREVNGTIEAIEKYAGESTFHFSPIEMVEIGGRKVLRFISVIGSVRYLTLRKKSPYVTDIFMENMDKQDQSNNKLSIWQLRSWIYLGRFLF